MPSGPGNIRAIDLTRTTRAKLYNVSAFDALTSDFTVKVGPNATLYNDNFAREGTDCTSPFPTTPNNSNCIGGGVNVGQCCYGPSPNLFIGGGGSAFNTQPPNATTTGLVTGTDAQLTRVVVRGTTGMSIGSRSRVDESTLWPQNAVSGLNLGPGGVSTNGFLAADTSQVTKSFALNLGGGTCVSLSGANSGAIGMKCAGAVQTAS